MDNEIDILAKTIYGESRGESADGQRAVGLVVINRYKSNKWFAGNSIADTCLKRLQFSCWNQNDPNYDIIRTATAEQLKPFIELARGLVAGEYADITNGATHYHTKNCHPAWSRGKMPCAEIGNHIFYKNID